MKGSVLLSLVCAALGASSDVADDATSTVTVTDDDYTSTTTVRLLAKIYETEYIWTTDGQLTSTVVVGSTVMETITTPIASTDTTVRETVSADPSSVLSATETAATSSEAAPSLPESSSAEPAATETASTEPTAAPSIPDDAANAVSPGNSTVESTSESTGSSAAISPESVIPSSDSVSAIVSSEPTASEALPSSILSDVSSSTSEPMPPLGGATSSEENWISTISRDIPEGSYQSSTVTTTTTLDDGSPAVLHLVVLTTEVCEC
ncbi:hypothetical protein DICA4_B01398 [Diutina catenulata]